MTRHCLRLASSSIFPSSITAPVPSPMAALTRRAWATSSALGLNTQQLIMIVGGVEGPGPHASEEERVAELVLAGDDVGDVPNGP